MKNSFTSTMKSRASSAKPKKIETPINMAKREKLRQLIIEKLIKKLNVNINHKSYIEKEVTLFIQEEKLTDENLKRLEEKLKKKLDEIKSTENLSNQLVKEKELKEKFENFEDLNLNSLKPNQIDDNKSIFTQSNASQFSRKLSFFDNIKYDEITDFQLRKLLQNDNMPSNKLNKDNNVTDEWTAITKYKAKKLEEIETQNKFLERTKKLQQKEIYNKQIKEKVDKKIEQDQAEKNYHRVLMDNVEKSNQLEKKKREEELAKKKIEKETREKQIQDKIEKKLGDFSSNRNFDKKLLHEMNSKNEIEYKKEQEKQSQTKQNLQRMLKDNEEFKKRQTDNLQKEKEDDIKAMEEYSKILDKQEQDRINYFKKCESRQLEAMNRMAENLIKKDIEKMKQEDEKMIKYQIEKERRDQEEEERRKNYLKDSKVKMRDFLVNQMDEKKEMNKNQKNIESEQVDIWNRENKIYFEKHRELDQKMKNKTKLYAEFLKSQMNDRKKALDKMNEEEYKMNREIIDEMASKTPSVTKRNFLI